MKKIFTPNIFVNWLKPALCCGLLALVSCAEVPVAPEGPKTELAFPPPPDEPRFYHERTIYGSAGVTEQEEDAGLKKLLTGAGVVGEGLTKPYGVTVYQGRVYVADTAARDVKVFDLPNRKFFEIGAEDPGSLRLPLGIDSDAAGNIYVTDGTQKRIMIYDKDGKFLRSVGGPEWFSRPSSVTVDREGKRVYAVDIGGVSNDEAHRIRVFDALTGEHLHDIGKRGTGDGELNLPRDAVFSKDGDLLYVVDSGNFRVSVFRPDGTYVRSFGQVGLQFGSFSRPKEIAVDRNTGNIYVIDTAFGNFQIFNPEGQLLMFIGTRSETDRTAKFSLPAGIAVDEDGRVYVTDQHFRKVEVFRPANIKPEEGYAVLGKALKGGEGQAAAKPEVSAKPEAKEEAKPEAAAK